MNEVDVRRVQRDGYAIIPAVLDDGEADALASALERAKGEGVRRREGVYAIRNLLGAVPEVRALAQSETLQSLIAPVLGAGAFVVRGILFDKTMDVNWKVIWHQDLSIAVRERREIAGFGPWSEKAGVTHVQPPAELLARMLTVRLHLDDCDADNGPLRVLPGSHAAGRLSPAQVADWRERAAEITCPVPRGGALLMRPLLLHASSEAKAPRHRRVVHLEYAREGLPGGLAWWEQA